MTAVKKYALLSLCGLTLFCARAQMPATNYDESQVPAYTLPDPLTTIASKKVTDAETWISRTATRWATWPPAGRSPSTSPRATHIS